MTIEAWVRPTALHSAWHTVFMKEHRDPAADTRSTPPATPPQLTYTGDRGRLPARRASLNAWSHLAGDLRRPAPTPLRQRHRGDERADTGAALTRTARCGSAATRSGASIRRRDRRGARVRPGRSRRPRSRPTVTPRSAARRSPRARSTRSAAVRVVPRRHTRNADRLSPRTRRKVHRGTDWLNCRRPVARHRRANRHRP